MDASHKTMFKAVGFGVLFGCFFFLFQRWLTAAGSAAVSAILEVILFHWAPPRVHRDLPVALSLLTAVGAGALAGGAVFLVERFL